MPNLPFVWHNLIPAIAASSPHHATHSCSSRSCHFDDPQIQTSPTCSDTDEEPAFGIKILILSNSLPFITIPPHLHPHTREAVQLINTVANQVTIQGLATPLIDTHGPVPTRTQGQDHARGPHHQSLANPASCPGTSESEVNEKLWTLSSNVMVMRVRDD